MHSFLHQLWRSTALTAVLALLVCAAYPLAVWAVAQGVFPDEADGSLVRDASGRVRGSRLLAQGFTGEKYFHPRPSAAGSGYDAAASSGSNLGPTSRALADQVAAAIAVYRAENRLPPEARVPADAVTRSGSGLDPDISPGNAHLQVNRVARARGLPESEVEALLAKHTLGPDWGIFGESRVNVFSLNLALDALRSATVPTP